MDKEHEKLRARAGSRAQLFSSTRSVHTLPHALPSPGNGRVRPSVSGAAPIALRHQLVKSFCITNSGSASTCVSVSCETGNKPSAYTGAFFSQFSSFFFVFLHSSSWFFTSGGHPRLEQVATGCRRRAARWGEGAVGARGDQGRRR
mmetsp:Transcript_10731/g.20783  ORF Transcript_10731/g.20783 Transcript_10731/m.20783 type:complete len:146 (+) Transcript_10731:331-768(+)